MVPMVATPAKARPRSPSKATAAKTLGAKTPRTPASKIAGAKRAASARPRWSPDVRAGLVVGLLGNRRAAELLGVSESQPSRWKTGAEVPGPIMAARLVDLDHVLARLLLVWGPEVAFDWLSGPNPFLDGSRPIDVLVVRGSTDVVAALDAEAAGAYA